MQKKRGFVNKKGQLTIFIILGIFVVAVVAVFFAVPGLRESVGLKKTESPENFIQNCLENEIKSNAEQIGLNGGSLEPEFYYLYQGNQLQYLCYSNEYYKPCVVQIPFLRKHIETEIAESIKDDVEFCFDSLEQNYQKSNYQTTLKKGETRIDLLPGRIITTINNEFTFSKNGATERREEFSIVVNSKLYELSAISENIVEWEATIGDANVDRYKDFYSWLTPDKFKQTDGTTVYILAEKETGGKFQFASRSIALSPLD